MRRGLVIAMGCCLLFAWTSTCSSAPAAAPMVGDYLSYFTIPPPNGRSYTIQNKLLAYINGATPGSEIRGHITTISIPAIASALIAAHKRGVAIYLVQDGRGVKVPKSSPEGDRLEDYFGTRHKYCYEDRGKRGRNLADITSCVSRKDGATHHIKNWLFSNTVVSGSRRTYSTWVTSYNLTKTSTKQFNDVFIVNDNRALYMAYVASFRSFYNQVRSDDFYNVAGRGHHVIPSANTEISYSPQKTGDFVAMALSRIDRYEPGCSLRVANLTISGSRDAVISELLRIRALGCRVQLAFSKTYAGAVRSLIGRVELRMPCKTTIHSKMMLYKGRYDGAPGRTLVWGGSHNWSETELRGVDDVFVAISRLGIYTNYRAYFKAIWDRSTPVSIHVNNCPERRRTLSHPPEGAMARAGSPAYPLAQRDRTSCSARTAARRTIERYLQRPTAASSARHARIGRRAGASVNTPEAAALVEAHVDCQRLGP